MCRYSFKDYKSHFACFDCRKAFKKTAITSWVKQKGLEHVYDRLRIAGGNQYQQELESKLGTSLQDIVDAYLTDVSSCPDCGREMAAMGFDFKAPKKTAIEEWKIIQLLYEHGFAFRGCGCDVGYSPPRKLGELEEFFLEHERLTEGQELLARFAGREA